MAISGHASYISTMDEFLAHWIQVNTALGADGPLVLPSGMTIGNLDSHRTALQTLASDIAGLVNNVEIAREPGTTESSPRQAAGRIQSEGPRAAEPIK